MGRDRVAAHRVERRVAARLLDHAIANLAGFVDQQRQPHTPGIAFHHGLLRIAGRPEQIAQWPS
jgi:cytochrome c553